MSADSYDQLQYPSMVHASMHLESLATISSFLGLKTMHPERCRVLDIGCATGSSIMALAELYPDSHFVGIDYSAEHIHAGKRTLQEAGFDNVELLCLDVMDMEDSLGKFDYILAHGLYSWLPDNVKGRVLGLIKEHLADKGVAFLSFNVFPGYQPRILLRDMMRFHVRNETDPLEKVEKGRDFMRFLSQIMSEKSLYGLTVRSGWDYVANIHDSFFYHDLLEDNNDPLYFNDFAARIKSNGFRYLGDAERIRNKLEKFAPAVKEYFSSFNLDLEEEEQYVDLLENCAFRKALLCHDDINVNRAENMDLVRNCFFGPGSPRKPELITEGKGKGGLRIYNRDSQSMIIGDQILVSLVYYIYEKRPGLVSFQQLMEELNARAGSGAVEESWLMNQLYQGWVNGYFICSANMYPVYEQIDERPLALSFARVQSRESGVVPNLLLWNVELDAFYRCLLWLLDGSRDMAALVRDMRKESEAGEGDFAGIVSGKSEKETERLVRKGVEFFSRTYLLKENQSAGN